MGLTRCYKTAVFYILYILKFSNHGSVVKTGQLSLALFECVFVGVLSDSPNYNKIKYNII